MDCRISMDPKTKPECGELPKDECLVIAPDEVKQAFAGARLALEKLKDFPVIKEIKIDVLQRYFDNARVRNRACLVLKYTATIIPGKDKNDKVEACLSKRVRPKNDILAHRFWDPAAIADDFITNIHIALEAHKLKKTAVGSPAE